MSVMGCSNLLTARGTGNELANDDSMIKEGIPAFYNAIEHGEVKFYRLK
jgi:hypothetical protein